MTRTILMINLTSNRAKLRALAYINTQMEAIEKAFTREVNLIFIKQYNAVADFIELGGSDIDFILNQTILYFESVFKKQYTRIYVVFGNIIFDSLGEGKAANMYQTKSIRDIYLAVMAEWVRSHMAERLVRIFRTTKKKIAKLIGDMKLEGYSNREIAKEIRAAAPTINKVRAATIARTETHTAAMKSTSEAMASTRLKYNKEWVSAMDTRTRKKPYNHQLANGETVGKTEMYYNTGEPMLYPGWEQGSAGNVINCRCVEIYHTIEQ